MLADKLQKFEGEECAVIALNEGGILIGAEIANRLSADLFLMLVTADIDLPGENDPVAVMSSAGTFTYNSMFSAGQLEELISDYRPIIDQERLETFHKLNRIAGKDGFINRVKLKDHTIILVSDGFKNGLSLDVAADFLKPVNLRKILVATPIASVPAVDRMHLLADEIFCLGVIDNFFDVDHYYKDNKIPDHEEAIAIMKAISRHIKRSEDNPE